MVLTTFKGVFMMKIQILVLIYFFPFLINAEGFLKGTLIKTPENYKPIEIISVGDKVISCGFGKLFEESVVTRIEKISMGEFVHVYFDGGIEIIAEPEQKFFSVQNKKWIKAYQIKQNEILSAYLDQTFRVISVQKNYEKQIVYRITVEPNHNYFITKNDILVHNFFVTIPLLSWAVGEGFILFGGISLGAIAVAYGNFIAKEIIRKTAKSLIFEDEKFRLSDAQAPGKPTTEDGFEVPKRSDGKKVKHPKTGQYGWQDSKGNIWVPTGIGPRAHGGPHWDVIDPQGRHRNIMPGENVRGRQ
jgi:hypothetical protein